MCGSPTELIPLWTDFFAIQLAIPQGRLSRVIGCTALIDLRWTRTQATGRHRKRAREIGNVASSLGGQFHGGNFVYLACLMFPRIVWIPLYSIAWHGKL